MGYRPVAPVKIGYEFVYLYLTLCPFTGEGFAAFLPKLDGASFSWFVEQMQAYRLAVRTIHPQANVHAAFLTADGKLLVVP